MKRITKNILIIILSFTVMWNYTFAADTCSNECLIADAPPTELTKYLSNVNIILSKVRAQTNRQVQKNDSYFFTLRGTTKQVIGGYSSIFNWNSYFSSFWYYVTLPLTQSIPAPVKRDIQLLENHIKMLTNLMEATVKRWHGDTKIEKVCQDFPEWYECSFTETEDARFIITALINNAERMLNFIRLWVQWKQDKHVGDFILVKNNFRTELNTYYNSYALEKCWQCQWEINYEFGQKMESITSFNLAGNKWIQRWIDAINLLLWNVSDAKYQQIERQILARELGRQWLNAEQSQIILWNLDRYNNDGWYSLSNNFVANSFDSIGTELWKFTDEFTDAFQKAYERYGENPVPIVEFVNIKEEIAKWRIIEKEVMAFYGSNIPTAMQEDTSSEKLLSKIVSYHISLSEIIKNLDTIIPVSEAVCDSQANWTWKCSYR